MRCEDWVPDRFWRIVEPLLPPDKPAKSNGRPRVPNRRIMGAVIFVLKTGAPWYSIPSEWGFSGKTAWDRFNKWRELGIWGKVMEASLKEANSMGRIDWRRSSIDSSSVPSPRGALKRVQTRQIVANPVANAIWSSMPKDSPSA